MARLAPTSKPPRTAPRLPQGLIDELERRHAGMARHMARAVVTLVRWDASTGLPPQRGAIGRACEGGLDQVAAEVTKTYLHAREQHMQRGTRAHARLFHALISDNFDSELELQRQALALNTPLAASGYVAIVCKLVVGNRDGERGGQALAEVTASLDMPRGALVHATDPSTLVILWPAESLSDVELAKQFLVRLQEEAGQRSGTLRARVRAGVGSYHPGLHGISRSFLEAQQAIEAGRKLRPDSLVHGHDEVIPHLVLAQNPRLAERFVNHSLGRLMDPKVRNRGQLLETL